MLGGDGISVAIREHTDESSHREVAEFKNEKGLSEARRGNKPLYNAMMEVVNPLAEEMNRHARYWQTHGPEAGRGRAGAVHRVILCGGNANLMGLSEELSRKLKLPVVLGNVWTNALSLDEYIPEVDFHNSLSFAPAAGLALHARE